MGKFRVTWADNNRLGIGPFLRVPGSMMPIKYVIAA
jgi:hypothetical protein